MKRINARHGITMQNPDSLFNYFGWPSVAKLPDGTLAATASGFRLQHVCPFGKAVIAYSRDNGETWTRPAAVIDTPLDDRDAGITCIGGNRVMITSFNNTAEVQHDYAGADKESDSEWTKKVRALRHAYCDLIEASGKEDKYYGSTYVISEDGGYNFGEVKKAPVSSIHGPFVTPAGEVLYVGRTWETRRDEADRIELWKLGADDNFEFVSVIENVCDDQGELLSCEPCGIALPDGKIIIHIRVQRHGESGVRKQAPVFTTYQCESTDGGKTFTKPYDLGNNGAPCHIMRHSTGVLIATYGYRSAPYGQRVMFSYDDGKTWDMDYILRDDAPSADLGYPCTVELDDGSLLTVYYQCEQGHENTVVMQSKWTLDDVVKG